MGIIDQVFGWFPRKKRVRGETTARGEGGYEVVRSVTESALSDGFPGGAALAVALQTSGIDNVVAVMERLEPSDIDRITERITGNSETLPQLVRQTQYASHDSTRDLLTRILRGELDNPDQTPRSVVDLVGKLDKRDLEMFLKLRRVLWFSESLERRAEIYCMYDADGYPGLLNGNEMTRLGEIGLLHFAPLPYQSNFPGPVAQRIVSFGDKKLQIVSTTPDAVLQSGHWGLTGDGRFLIGIYEDDEVELLEDQFDFNADAWRSQGFNVEDVSATHFILRGVAHC